MSDPIRQPVDEVGPLVTWCRIFAVGPPCATPCDSCRKRRDVHRLIRPPYTHVTPFDGEDHQGQSETEEQP